MKARACLQQRAPPGSHLAQHSCIVLIFAQYCPIEIVKWFNRNFGHLPDFSVVTAQVAEHEEARLSLHIFAL